MQNHGNNKQGFSPSSAKPGAVRRGDDRLVEWLQASDDHLVLIVFTAEWMGSTFMFKDSLERINNEYPGVALQEVDVEKDTNYAGEFGVGKIPTVVLLRHREVVDLVSGTISKFKLVKRMTPHLPAGSGSTENR